MRGFSIIVGGLILAAAFVGWFLRSPEVAVTLNRTDSRSGQESREEAVVLPRRTEPEKLSTSMSTLSLEFEADRLRVLGRILDSESNAMPRISFQIRPQIDRGLYEADLRAGLLVETDEEGRFQCDLAVLGSDSTLGAQLLFEFDDQNGLIVTAWAPVDAWLPGTLDVGDVRLERDPVVATGRVVDEWGSPMADVSVGIWGSMDCEEHWPFRTLLFARCSTDELGRFELRYRHIQETYQVGATEDGFVSAMVHVPRGREGLELVMTRDTRFKAHFQLAGPGNLGELEIILRRGKKEQKFSMPSNGRFDVRVLAGTFDLKVTLGKSDKTVVLERKRLSVLQGTTLDLGNLGISELPREVKLSIVGADGTRPRGRIASIALDGALATGQPAEFRKRLGEETTFKIFVHAFPIAIDVEVHGFGRAAAVITDIVHEVKITPGPRVRIELGTYDWIPEDVTLLCAVRRQGVPRIAPDQGRLPTFEEVFALEFPAPMLDVQVARPGRYWIDLGLYVRHVPVDDGFQIERGKDHFGWLAGASTTSIDVTNVTTLQHFEVPIDRSVLEALLKRLREEMRGEGR